MLRPLSFSLYLDFLLAVGGARFTAAKSASAGAPVDCYGAFKALAGRYLTGDAEAFERLMAASRDDAQRLRLYPSLIKGFTKWVEKHGPVAAGSPCVLWSPIEGVSVAVNPEVVATIAGVPHVIKLHTRKGRLARPRVELAVAILRDAIPGAAGTVHGVLDVRAGKLHTVMGVALLERNLAVARAEGEAFMALRLAQNANTVGPLVSKAEA